MIRSLTFFLFILSSCSKPEVKIPPDLLDQPALTHILIDIHLAQASAGTKERVDSVNVMNDGVEEILAAHGISRADLLRNLKFYSEHPALLQQVYDSVITGLSRMQGEAEGIREPLP
jgi:hypothetical protein